MAQLKFAPPKEYGFSAEDDQALLERACAVRPLLAQHAQQHEDEGELSPEAVAALDKAGFWKMAVPRRWGGLSTSAHTMAKATAELGKGCPSAAWVIAIMNSGVWLVTLMPDAIQEEVFASGVPRIASCGVPQGKAVKVDGGYLVTGRWGYASGSHHAEWLHCPLAEPEGAQGPGGLFIAPASDFEVVRTWNVAGMKGTGSDTVAADELFVPEHRAVWFREGTMGPNRPGARHTGEVTDRWALMPLLRAKGLGVLVGAVQGLLEMALSENPQRSIVHTTYGRKLDSAVFQAGIGEAGAMVRAAATLMDKTTHSIDLAALECREPSYAERAENRGDASLAVQLLGQAADKLMNMLGSSAFATAHAAQRYWRDFHAGSRHAVYLPQVGFEVSGRAMLGIGPEANITLPEMI